MDTRQSDDIGVIPSSLIEEQQRRQTASPTDSSVATGPPPVEIRDLTVAYHERPVLWDVDLTIRPGKLTAIVGPNGAGKSTLIKAALGLVPAAAGWVKIFGEPFDQQRLRVAYVPQRGSVDWDFPTDALDVVTMGLYGHLGWLKRPGKNERAEAMHALELVGVPLCGRDLDADRGSNPGEVRNPSRTPSLHPRNVSAAAAVRGVDQGEP